MVELYLQILLPAYRFIIGFQRTKANIAEVVPSLLVLFSIWNRLARNKRFKCICLKMIESFKLKFDYELKSNVYLVAALLNPSKLSIWYWKDFNEAYATDALKELTAVCTSLMKTGKPKKAKPHIDYSYRPCIYKYPEYYNYCKKQTMQEIIEQNEQYYKLKNKLE
jgi:hypothetical protein